MIFCDAFTRVKPAKDVLNIVWLLFHLVGLAANLWACWALKKKWTSLGSFKLLLGTSIFSNVFSLVTHLYLPINFMLRGATGLQWSFGSLLCTVLPPVANFALAASILGLLAVAMEHYCRNTYKDEVSLREAENTTVLVWAIASLITAPQFCQCGKVPESYLDAGNCIQSWQFTDPGRFYEATRLILQYIIPFSFIANLLIKLHIYPTGLNKCSKFRRFIGILADILSGILIGVAVFLFPARTLMSARNPSHTLPIPDVAAANQVFEFLAIFCCIAAPFQLVEILNGEESNAAPRKTNELNEYKTTATDKTKGKLGEKVGKEKISDELLISLVNEEPLRLKNEIMV